MLTPGSVSAQLKKALGYLNLTGDLKGTQRLMPDVSANIVPTGLEEVVISLTDIVLLLSDEQQTRLLQLGPAALDGDTAGLALAKGLVHRHRNSRALAVASFDSARVLLEGALRRQTNDHLYRAMLGLALAGLGEKDKAVREGERAIALLPLPMGGMDATLRPANLARIQVLLNNRENAIKLLENILSGPSPLSAAWLRVDPFWDPLRSSPQFQRLATTRN